MASNNDRHPKGVRSNASRFPDAVQRSSRCTAEPGPRERYGLRAREGRARRI